MLNYFSDRAGERRGRFASNVFVAAVVVAAVCLSQRSLYAQGANSEGDLGACTLKNHIYTCDGAVFHKALESATTV